MRLVDYGYRTTYNASRRRKALKTAAQDYSYDEVITTLINKKYGLKQYKVRRIEADISYLEKEKEKFNTGFNIDIQL